MGSTVELFLWNSNNCIDTTTDSNNYGFIGGGVGNTISSGAHYSAIIGGSGNTVPAGMTYAAIFGQNITAVNAGAMHLDNMWLNPTAYCSYPGVAPFGTFSLGTVYVDISLAGAGTLRVQI